MQNRTEEITKALKAVVEILEPLNPEERERVIKAAEIILDERPRRGLGQVMAS